MLYTDRLAAPTVLFQSLSEEFAALAGREGYYLRPYKGSFPSEFSKLSPQTQSTTLAHFSRYVEVSRSVVNQSGSLLNDQLFLWRMFKNLRVHPPSELMSQIQDGDVVEIHNPDFVQVYRNLSSFSLCSYTLDDLLCRPFWELFQRDDFENQRLLDFGRKVFSGEIGGVTSASLGAHTVLEIDSPGRYLSVVEYRLFAPLWDSDGNAVAMISVVRPISCVRTSAPRTQIAEVNIDL